ncbi:MAG: hypothetical protein J6Z47_01360 [Bacteroidales bacterium]|nr:hypothetical protein [Bacteroidales bacterium]
MKRLCLSIFLLMSCLIAGAEGLPFSPIVRNWSVRQNHAAKQNWSLAQADDGVIIIGNGKGLLEFDGHSWLLHDLVNGNCVRSVMADGDRIYIGAYRQFGYWDRKAEKYVSLSDTLEKDKVGDDDVWNICKTADGTIVFQSFSAFYTFDGKEVTTVGGIYPLNLFSVRGKLWSQQIEGGFFTVNPDGTLGEEIIGDPGQGGQIVSVLPYGEEDILLLTLSDGLKVYHKSGSLTRLVTDFEDKLRSNTFNRGCRTPEGLYLLGSVTDGLFACDSLGHLKWSANTRNGLQNNTVLGFTTDRDKNVWVALDDGISLIKSNSALSRYKPFQEDIGMVYDVLDHGGRFYLATNQGLFVWSGGNLKRLSNDKDQVWYVSAFGDQVLSGNNTGTLSIIGENSYKEKQDVRNIGSFCIRRAYLSDGNAYLVEGTYSGLNIYSQTADGRWAFRNSINGLSLTRQIEIDSNGEIWCQHFHGGIKKVRLNDSLTGVGDIEEFEEIGGVRGKGLKLFKVNGAICVHNGKEYFTYEQMQGRFIPYEAMNTALAALEGVHGVVPANGRNYWFVGDEEASLVNINGQDIRIVREINYSLFGEYSEENASMVYDSDNKATYLCLPNQVVRIGDEHLSHPEYATDLTLFEIGAYDDELNYQDGLQDPKHRFKPGYDYVKIVLRYPHYITDNLSMKMRLRGVTDVWHTGGLQMEHNFYGLKPGKYRFEASVCDEDGCDLSTIEVPFVLRRPWYGSIFMKVIYLLLGILGVMVTERIFSYLKKLYDVHTEKEALESELKDKSNELAAMAAKGMAIDDENWEMFKRNLDRMDEKFFVKLQSAYPSLTSADLKFCALLRMNMSTKEIANTLNLTTRGVESARYRLRKKFGLEASDSLTGFIINFTQSQRKDSE